jgi:hypothetical protein
MDNLFAEGTRGALGMKPVYRILNFDSNCLLKTHDEVKISLFLCGHRGLELISFKL